MARNVPFAGADDDAHVIVFPWVRRVRQIFIRAVKVNVVVVIAVEKRANVERAAQADEMTDGVGMTKRNVCGVVSAEARAADCHPMSRTFPAREVEHVAHDHVFVRVMGPHSIGRVNRLVVETLLIDRVRAVNCHSPIVDVPRDGADQPEILVLIITRT